MRIKCTNFWDGGLQREQTTGRSNCGWSSSPCVLTLRSVIKDRSQSETPEASPTPLCLLAQPPSLPLPPLPLFSSSPGALISSAGFVSPVSPPTHYTFCFRSSSSLLVTSPPTAAALRPRQPALPNAADINQLLCGKQREGRREREGWEEEEKAWRQPVIRTNMDGLCIAD